MVGHKFFVPFQTLRRQPFAASRNLCHPGVIFSVKKIGSVYLVAELIRKFSGWLVFFFSVGFCLGSLCPISVSRSREYLAVTFRNCCKKLPFIDLNFKRYFLKIKFVCLLKGEACQKLSANWLIQPLACNFWFLKSWRENMVTKNMNLSSQALTEK